MPTVKISLTDLPDKQQPTEPKNINDLDITQEDDQLTQLASFHEEPRTSKPKDINLSLNDKLLGQKHAIWDQSFILKDNLLDSQS